ncbi:MAG: hypothetical protein NUW01_14230 [Gemmatimonadaceae bacterium]|nr:hypothetical protein [Gemmatimonadaceae bacterium]
MTPTTVDLGQGQRAGTGGDTGSMLDQIGQIGRGILGEEGAKVTQAIIVTEGGLGGAVGDLKGGGSYGPLQFYWQGQLGNFAHDLGMSLQQAAQYAQQHPLEAVKWALNGYLGNAIRDGMAKGLTGSALATYAQQHGQVSVSPERAGQNYDALFGGGGSASAGIGIAGRPLNQPQPQQQQATAPSSSGTDLIGSAMKTFEDGLANLKDAAGNAVGGAVSGMGERAKAIGDVAGRFQPAAEQIKNAVGTVLEPQQASFEATAQEAAKTFDKLPPEQAGALGTFAAGLSLGPTGDLNALEKAAGTAPRSTEAILQSGTEALNKLKEMRKGEQLPSKNLGQRLSDLGTLINEAAFDQSARLAKVQAGVAKRAGRTLSEAEMATEMTRLNAQKAAEINLQEGLAPALRKVGTDQPELSDYLILWDNVDTANMVHDTAGPDAAAERAFSGGLSAQSSADGIRTYEATGSPEQVAKIKQTAQQVWDFNKSLLQRSLDAGIINQKTFDALRERYPHYVPTRITDYLKEPTNIPAGRTFGLSDAGFRRNTIEGTTKARENPILSTVRNAVQTESMARRNEAFQAFDKWVNMDDLLAEQVRIVPDSYVKKIDEEVVPGFVNGVSIRYVMPKELGMALKGASSLPEAPAFVIKVMSAFRAGATSRNPVFLIGNALKDAGTYYIVQTARHGGNPLMAPRITAELFRAYADTFGGLLSGTYTGAETARFLKQGGGMFGFYSGRTKDTQEIAARLGRSNALEIKTAGDAKRLLKQLVTLAPVEAIGERIELAPRVASMRLAERQGKGPVQATIAGRSVTIDFAQGGTVAKWINQIVPFFNVGMQGLALPTRVYKANPRGAIIAGIMTLAQPTMFAEGWNRSDKQRAIDYEDVPQWEKDRGIVFMLPGEQPVNAQGDRVPQYILIPTREYTPIVLATREAVGRAMGAQGTDAGMLLWNMFQSTSPISGDSPGSIVGQVGLPGITTVAQLEANYDFFRGSHIASKYMDDHASEISKTIAAGLTALGIDARPSQVEFAIRDVGTGVAGAALGATQVAAGVPENTSQVGTLGDVPVVGGLAHQFVRNYTGERLRKSQNETVPSEIKDKLDAAGIKTSIGPVGGTIDGIPLNRTEQEYYQQETNRLVAQRLARVVAREGFTEKQVQSAVSASRQGAAQETLRIMKDRAARKRAARGGG